MHDFLASTAFEGRTVVVVGGGTGIGFAVAQLVVAAGGRVVIGGRTAATLDAAVERLGDRASSRVVDTADAVGITRFFEGIERVDGLLTTAATYVTGPMSELTVEQAASAMESKFWGQYRVVRAALPVLAPDAAIVLVSGAASVRPPGPAPAYVAANAAVEGLARGLAVELAPIRVNAVAPGTVDGALWARRDPEVRAAAFAKYTADATAHRLSTETEIAQTVVYLMLNRATTGSTLYPDGGYSFR